MLDRPALVLICSFALAAHASGADDALQAVHEAQKASEDGAACKGLATKLKLAIEAIEDAKKAPARLQQAKGRVEVAKDFAATACTDAVRSKVTDALATAVAALDQAAHPPKPEHPGAALAASCTINEDCASEHCIVGASPPGYCSKLCSAASDCPAHWDCKRVGSIAEKMCRK